MSRRERMRRSRRSTRWVNTIVWCFVLAATSGCITSLCGLGVYGAVKDAQRWVQIPCGMMTDNSPYPPHVVCERVAWGPHAMGLDAVDVTIEWVESTCTPTNGKPGPCVYLPNTAGTKPDGTWSPGSKVAGYRVGAKSFVAAIHPDPFAEACRTVLAHESAHVALRAANKSEDPKHKRPEWKTCINGCNTTRCEVPL